MDIPKPVAGSPSASPYQIDMEDDSMHELIPIKTKPPQPARPGSPSLITLGYDITSLVIYELLISSPGTLLSVALVSSYYYELARYSRHGTVTLRLAHGQPRNVDPRGYGDRAEQRTDLLKWLNQTSAKGLLPAIRDLTINIDRNDDDKDPIGKQARDTLVSHLLRMTGLGDLTWSGDEILPDQIVQVLSERPGLRLHVHYKGKNRQRGVREENPHKGAFSVLVGLASLRSLGVESDYTTSQQCQQIIQPVKKVLLSCENLRKLKLNIHLPPFDGTYYDPPKPLNEFTGFDFVNGERPAAALRELELIDFPFRIDMPAIPQDLTELFCYQRTEMDYWADTFDWSRLERLVVPESYLAHKMVPHLKSLRHIEYHMTIADRRGLVQDFFSRIPDGLEMIKVTKISLGGLDDLLRHGSTLRKLWFHCREISVFSWQENAVYEAAIARIRDACVVLEDLYVDIGRGGDDWPYAMLDIIASFPRLRRFGLQFETSPYDHRNPVKPYVTASAARHIFDYLLSKSTVTPSTLRSIVIHLGPPRGEIPLTHWSHTEINSHAAFQCHVSDRDDDAPPHTYEFKVTYPTWSGAQSD